MKFIVGLVIGIIVLPLFALLFIYFGYAPVATSAPPFPFEKQLASMALDARIKKSAPAQSPVPADEQNLMAGAHVYREYCAVCHGLPDQPKTPTAQGMYPPPPQLFHGKGVTDDPAGETYWKVTNGIRLTGMPAYSALSDTERWQVSQMLANADKISAAVKAYLAQPPAAK
jgi:thiosulfate dehydrogenase